MLQLTNFIGILFGIHFCRHLNVCLKRMNVHIPITIRHMHRKHQHKLLSTIIYILCKHIHARGHKNTETHTTSLPSIQSLNGQTV